MFDESAESGRRGRTRSPMSQLGSPDTHGMDAATRSAQHDGEHRALVDALRRTRAVEHKRRTQVRRQGNLAAACVVIAGVAAMWTTARPAAFAGNGAAALRAMFWTIYLLFVLTFALAVRAILLVLRVRVIRDARAATATASARLNAWIAATHYSLEIRNDEVDRR